MSSLQRTADPRAAVENLTLPELLAAVENARRRIVERLQYDVLPHAKTLADGDDHGTGPLLQAHGFSQLLLGAWQGCRDAIQQRFNQIIDEASLWQAMISKTTGRDGSRQQRAEHWLPRCCPESWVTFRLTERK